MKLTTYIEVIMAVTITIDNETFEYPSTGQSPNWAEAATSTMEKVAEVLNSLKNVNDILTTTATIANNSSGNVNGLLFDNSEVRSAQIQYSVYRVTASNEVAEAGTMDIVYLNNANSWTVNRTYTGDAGMTFAVTAGGQVTFTSSNLAGASYSGTMKFKAITLPQ